MSGDEAYVEPGEVKKLAKSFELHAYDLQMYLKKFVEETGEGAISDGFGVLTESEEVTSAYIDYSRDVASAMKVVHEHLDAVGAALRQVTRKTEATDQDVAVLFGKNHDGGK